MKYFVVDCFHHRTKLEIIFRNWQENLLRLSRKDKTGYKLLLKCNLKTNSEKPLLTLWQSPPCVLSFPLTLFPRHIPLHRLPLFLHFPPFLTDCFFQSVSRSVVPLKRWSTFESVASLKSSHLFSLYAIYHSFPLFSLSSAYRSFYLFLFLPPARLLSLASVASHLLPFPIPSVVFFISLIHKVPQYFYTGFKVFVSLAWLDSDPGLLKSSLKLMKMQVFARSPNMCTGLNWSLNN